MLSGSDLQLIFHTKDIFANNGNDWSDPVHFNFTGYDTSLFWDDDGAVWVQGSHAYHVFPAIQQFRIDLETGKSLNGDPVTMWTGTGGLVSISRAMTVVTLLTSFFNSTCRLQKDPIYTGAVMDIISSLQKVRQIDEIRAYEY